MDNAKMATDAYNLRKAIEAEIIEVEENGIKIIIGGDLKIKNVFFNGSEDSVLKDAINSAIRKAQELQVLKMREMMDLESLS
jgi:DNA-binding protein YbaB